MSVRAIATVLAAGGMLTLTGCPPTCSEDYSRCPARYVSLRELVAGYNANAAAVPVLWARASVKVTLSDGKGSSFSWGSASPLADPNAVLILSKDAQAAGPSDFVMIGRELSAELFRLGVDAAGGLYYFWYNFGQRGEGWLGRCRFAGAPAVKSVPIDPMQLVSILGVTELPEVAPGKMPAVVLRLSGRPPAYVVSYLKPQPVTGELKLWREVSFHWSEDKPRRPFRVRLFDADGLCRMVAEVGEYKPIEWEGPPEKAPVVPTWLRICWPAIKDVQSASSLEIRLSDMSTTHAFRRTVFRFRPPPGVPVKLVDAVYGPVRKERPSR